MMLPRYEATGVEGECALFRVHTIGVRGKKRLQQLYKGQHASRTLELPTYNEQVLTRD